MDFDNTCEHCGIKFIDKDPASKLCPWCNGMSVWKLLFLIMTFSGFAYSLFYLF